MIITTTTKQQNFGAAPLRARAPAPAQLPLRQEVNTTYFGKKRNPRYVQPHSNMIPFSLPFSPASTVCTEESVCDGSSRSSFDFNLFEEEKNSLTLITRPRRIPSSKSLQAQQRHLARPGTYLDNSHASPKESLMYWGQYIARKRSQRVQMQKVDNTDEIETVNDLSSDDDDNMLFDMEL